MPSFKRFLFLVSVTFCSALSMEQSDDIKKTMQLLDDFFSKINIAEVRRAGFDPLLKSKKTLTEAEENDLLKNRPIVISLGDSCQPALNLMYAKLRFMAYPFDWIVAYFDDMYDLIKTDFMYCKERDYFVMAYDPKVNASRPTNVHYPQVMFPHVKWETLFEDFNRRIKRFYKAIHYGEASNKKIFFVIHSISYRDATVKDKATKICDLILEKFPSLDFTLIVMHHAKDLGDFRSDRCIFTYLEHDGWTQESYAEWRAKFAAMGLINPYAFLDPESEHPFQ